MPKLKSYDTDSFSFAIGNKTLKFANVRGQRTYIKNRMDRLLTKEPETIKWINQFAKDSVFFDVGANIGIYTLYSAVMRQNTVYSFEPHSASYKNLLDSINLNHLDNCHAFCLALSDKVTLSAINVKNTHEGVADNRVGQRGDYYHGCIEMNLDHLVSNGILPQPTHIKIDVDGFEDKVLTGAMSTIKKCKSALVEIDNKHIGMVQKLKDEGLVLESQHKRNEEEFNYIFKNADR